MNEVLSLPIQTLFADLSQRDLDAEFLDNFEKSGSFRKKKRRNRYYWYFKTGSEDDLYVGPVTDKEITDKMQNFSQMKADFLERRQIVNAEGPRPIRRNSHRDGAATQYGSRYRLERGLGKSAKMEIHPSNRIRKARSRRH